MNNGIYSVSFHSTRGQLGTGGVAYIIDGKVFGGDSQFYYKGSVTESGLTLDCQIHVGAHQRPAQSIFGALTEFDLELAGNSQNGSFSLRGDVVGHAGLAIRIEGRKVADL